MTDEIVRVFLAHPKDDEPTADAQFRLREALARAGVPEVMNPERVQFVTGAQDFQLNFQRYGGWTGWAQSVATGREYRGAVPVDRFDVIIVTPDIRIGKATAEIVDFALRARKPVYWFDGMYRLAAVHTLHNVGGDFRQGWVIQ